MPIPRLNVVLVVLLVIAGLASRGHAMGMHPGGKMSPVSALPLADALKESVNKGRLLIVMVSPDTARAKKNEAVFNNPALRAWVDLHAIVVNVTDRETIRRLIEWSLAPTEPETPLVFRDGRKVRLFGSAAKGSTSRLRAVPREVPKRAEGDQNASIRLLMKLEWTLQNGQPADPGFLSRHLALNPIPPQPVPAAFAAVADEGVKACPPGTGGAGAAEDPLAMLEQARSAVDAKDYGLATGLYTALWERAASFSPCAAPMVLWTVTKEMHDLAQTHAPAKTRFGRMHLEAAARLPWAEQPGLFEYLMLSRAAGAQLEPLDFLDSALSDADGALMIPPGERAGLELLLPRANWADPLKLPQSNEPARYIESLERRREAKLPRSPTEQDLAGYRAFVDFLIGIEVPRLHVALLEAGRVDEAFEILSATPAKTRVAATAMALARNARHERHRALIDAEAARMWPGLAERLK
ncbi:MAG: hypothetical protein ACT4PL_11385 [Phycisphaerales bacterium]